MRVTRILKVQFGRIENVFSNTNQCGKEIYLTLLLTYRRVINPSALSVRYIVRNRSHVLNPIMKHCRMPINSPTCQQRWASWCLEKCLTWLNNTNKWYSRCFRPPRVMLIVYIFGLCTLYPWNMFITANSVRLKLLVMKMH